MNDTHDKDNRSVIMLREQIRNLQARLEAAQRKLEELRKVHKTLLDGGVNE